MPDRKRLIPTWLHFRLSHALVFTALVAALFGVSRLVDSSVNDLPDAPQVSLTFVEEQIAGGNVVSMQLRGVDDMVLGYAELSSPTSLGDSEASPALAVIVAMRLSDGSAAAVFDLLNTHEVPFNLYRSDRALTLLFPLVGTGVLVLAAIGFLRFRNRRGA